MRVIEGIKNYGKNVRGILRTMELGVRCPGVKRNLFEKERGNQKPKKGSRKELEHRESIR